jgi:hypothetical protein
MEKMKKVDEITVPDFASTAFAVLNLADGTSRAITLADFYGHAERIQVNETAPEDVRSYMEAVKTLYVYGWFYYPFYTLAAFLATTAVEMALVTKFQKRRSPGLARLYRLALKQGMIREENFPSRKHVQANRALLFGEETQLPDTPSPEREKPYAERVGDLLTYFRNVFAHPTGHWIMTPGNALDFLVLAGEVINQLWPPLASISRLKGSLTGTTPGAP